MPPGARGKMAGRNEKLKKRLDERSLSERFRRKPSVISFGAPSAVVVWDGESWVPMVPGQPLVVGKAAWLPPGLLRAREILASKTFDLTGTERALVNNVEEEWERIGDAGLFELLGKLDRSEVRAAFYDFAKENEIRLQRTIEGDLSIATDFWTALSVSVKRERAAIEAAKQSDYLYRMFPLPPDPPRIYPSRARTPPPMPTGRRRFDLD